MMQKIAIKPVPPLRRPRLSLKFLSAIYRRLITAVGHKPPQPHPYSDYPVYHVTRWNQFRR